MHANLIHWNVNQRWLDALNWIQFEWLIDASIAYTFIITDRYRSNHIIYGNVSLSCVHSIVVHSFGVSCIGPLSQCSGLVAIQCNESTQSTNEETVLIPNASCRLKTLKLLHIAISIYWSFRVVTVTDTFRSPFTQ